MKMHKDFGAASSSSAAKPLDVEDQKGETTSLLDRIGGNNVLRSGIEKMFDTAISSTPVGVLLRKSAASVRTLQELYIQEVTAFFETVPGQGREQQVLDRLGDAHRPWDFSDAIFDALVDHFAQAISTLGVRPEPAQEAVRRFRGLRAKVTAGYRAGCTFARKQNTAAWRSKVATEADCPERSAGFAKSLSSIVLRHSNLGPKAPPELQQPEALKAHLIRYFKSEARVVSPIPLEVPSMSLVELGELMDCARQALVESCWSADEVLLLQFAMSDHWDHIRLNRALNDLVSHTRSIDRVAWTSFMLRLQMAFNASAPNRAVCENNALPMCLARICEVMAARCCEDPWQLSFNSCNLSISDTHFDSLIELIPGACLDLQPAAAQKVVAAMQAMRAFVVQACTNTARAG